MANDISLLAQAQSEFEKRVILIGDTQWDSATPCTEFTVRDLVTHLIQGSLMSERFLALAPEEEITALLGVDQGPDMLGALQEAISLQNGAFGEDGAMERTIHHPHAGDMPGAQLYGFAVVDFTIHTWDLARAIGADESLPPDLVSTCWGIVEPMAPMIAHIGVFGPGPSGDVPESAPLQTRLLDMTGRRP